jgi:hypothetical protein
MTQPLLQVEDLRTHFLSRWGTAKAMRRSLVFRDRYQSANPAAAKAACLSILRLLHNRRERLSEESSGRRIC